ncbi:hypothetical protein ColTof4_00598 [Colletotrichum tofieldiae]|nr:hypothetical protein ColTof3_07805 [Colletotrichum tofieldiae]GKT68175.1 hypothetical protein ColTof4_00598 [Colletotrichum tofieldiae]
MFDHFAIGTKARSGVDAVGEEPNLSPRQRPQELHKSTEAVASSSACAPAFDHKPSNPPQPIDSLVHELSKQTLIPEIRQPITRVTATIGTLPSIVADLSTTALEVDEDCSMDLSVDDIKEHQPVADWKRARRQRYSRFINNPNNARAIKARVEDMISEESQCNVHPALSLSSLPSTVPTYPHLSKIEADCFPEANSSTRHLEPDEGFCEEDEEFALMQRVLVAGKERLIGTSGPMQKFVPLRFRGSAETALRCQNVVRQRPRMRRRKGPGPTQEPRPTWKA